MKIAAFWQKFWFEPIDLMGVAWTRTFLGATLFFSYLLRFENLNLLTSEALLPREQALKLFPEIMRPAWSWTFWPDSWAMTVHVLFCLGLFLWTFGVGGRILGILIWVTHMGFIQRNYSIVFGADIMAGLFLFYLVFVETPEVIKNFSLFRKKNSSEPFTDKKSDFVSTAMVRLLQIQLAVIYAYTGFEKLKGSTWWDGTALWAVFANPQMVWMDLSFIKSISWVLPLIAFSTVVFEVYFPAAVLSQRTRSYWLFAGFLFHIGIGFLMSLWSFSLVMLSIYFLFIDPLILRQVLLKMRHKNYFK